MEKIRENPIRKARVDENLSPAELAMLGGTDVTVVSQCELGRRASVHPGILKALQSLGYDPATVANDYAQWRAAMAEEILSARRASGQ